MAEPSLPTSPETGTTGATSGSVPSSTAALGLALDRVGDRWSLLLVDALLGGSRRFGELGEDLPGIAPNILADRLRRLERGGIIVATPYSRRPLRMEYALTLDGRELAGALRLLTAWGARGGGPGAIPRHAVCGTPLETRWHCPTCARGVDDPDDEELVRL